MDIRNRELPDKGDPLLLDPLTLDSVAAKGIGTVQDDKLLSLLRTGLQALPHGADVGIAAAPDILHIEDEHIDSGEHLWSRLPGIAVEGVGRESCELVLAGTDLNTRLFGSVKTVLRSVERYQISMLLDNKTGLLPCRVHPGLVGHQPHPFAAQEVEVVLLQDIDSEFHGMKGSRRCKDRKEQERECFAHGKDSFRQLWGDLVVWTL